MAEATESTGLVMLASRWIPNNKFLPYAKVGIDTMLFFVSYLCQKLLVFRSLWCRPEPAAKDGGDEV